MLGTDANVAAERLSFMAQLMLMNRLVFFEKLQLKNVLFAGLKPAFSQKKLTLAAEPEFISYQNSHAGNSGNVKR